jgi:DNA-directed RNA polymerase sigma subunit (sigma70/sigma32)
MRQLKITKQVTNRETASLDKYLQEIGKVDLITADEEVELAQKIKAGDQQALEKLTKANLRFVVSVAKQYQNQGLTLPDLINEGNLGLSRRLNVLMKHVVSNSSPTLYGGFVNRYYKLWQNKAVSFVCPK